MTDGTAPTTSGRAVRPRRPLPHLTLAQFRELEAVLRANGYNDMIAWSETVQPPTDARTFAKEVAYVICNSGMNFLTANGIYWRYVRALQRGESSSTVFGHPGKTKAIDHVWQHRKVLLAAVPDSGEQARLLSHAAVYRGHHQASLGQEPRARHHQARRPPHAAG